MASQDDLSAFSRFRFTCAVCSEGPHVITLDELEAHFRRQHPLHYPLGKKDVLVTKDGNSIITLTTFKVYSEQHKASFNNNPILKRLLFQEAMISISDDDDEPTTGLADDAHTANCNNKRARTADELPSTDTMADQIKNYPLFGGETEVSTLVAAHWATLQGADEPVPAHVWRAWGFNICLLTYDNKALMVSSELLHLLMDTPPHQFAAVLAGEVLSLDLRSTSVRHAELSQLTLALYNRKVEVGRDNVERLLDTALLLGNGAVVAVTCRYLLETLDDAFTIPTILMTKTEGVDEGMASRLVAAHMAALDRLASRFAEVMAAATDADVGSLSKEDLRGAAQQVNARGRLASQLSIYRTLVRYNALQVPKAAKTAMVVLTDAPASPSQPKWSLLGRRPAAAASAPPTPTPAPPSRQDMDTSADTFTNDEIRALLDCSRMNQAELLELTQALWQ